MNKHAQPVKALRIGKRIYQTAHPAAVTIAHRMAEKLTAKHRKAAWDIPPQDYQRRRQAFVDSQSHYDRLFKKAMGRLKPIIIQFFKGN